MVDGASEFWFSEGDRDALLNSLMRASHVVVLVDVLTQDTLQMGGIEDEDMVQAFLPDSTHPAFGIRIGIRCLVRRVNDMEVFTFEDGIKGTGEFLVIVVDQKAHGDFPTIEFPYHLSGLLSNPDLVGVGGDASQMHPA